MSFDIYQIGHVKVPRNRTSDTMNPWPEYQARGASVMPEYGYETLWQNTQYLNTQKTISLSYYLITDDERTADQQMQEMISMVGKPTDIIAFRMSDNEHQTGEGCHCYPNDPIWLHTRGVLRSATPSHNDPLTNPAATIQLSIEINNWWEPLNPIFWAWESEPFAYYNTTLAPEYVTPELVSEMPSAQDVLDRKKKWVRKVFDYPQFIYNPDGWENEFCDECGNLANGKASSWMQGNAWKETRGMPLTWNAPMRSMWAFKNLSGKSGVIEIKTVSGVAWEREDSTTTINLAQLNDDLLSRGVQIEDDDILMIGDVSHRPGFIMKREEVSGGRYLYLEVPNFTPIVNYARFWPGQLSVGNNRFMVITPSGVLYAYRHTYRSM